MEERKNNGLNISGFIVSLVSLILPALGFVGLGLGIGGLIQAKSNGGKKGLAIAAIVIGLITAVFIVLVWTKVLDVENWANELERKLDEMKNAAQ